VAENLKKFIDLYDAKTAEIVEKAKDQLEKFNTAREEALKLSTPVNEEYATLGKLVDAMIREDGSVNSTLFTDFMQYGTASKEEKELIKSLHKLKNGPAFYKNAEAQQKRGAMPFFNSAMQIFGKASVDGVLAFNKLIGTDSNEPEDKKISYFLESADELIADAQLNFPAGIIGPEFYYAVVENGNPIGKKEVSTTSPINEKPEQSAPAAGSVINEKKTGGEVGSAKSAVNPEKKEAAPTSIESSKVTSAPAEMPKEPEKPAKEATPGVVVNVESTSPSLPTPEEPKVTPATTPAPSTTINETSNVSTSIKEGDTTSVINSEEVENSYISSIYKQVEQLLGGFSPKLEEAYRTNVEAKKAASTINEKKEKSTAAPEKASPAQTKSTKSLVELASEIEKMIGPMTGPLETTKSVLASIPSLGSTPINESKSASKFSMSDVESFKKYVGIDIEKLAAGEMAGSVINEKIKPVDIAAIEQIETSQTMDMMETTAVSPSLPSESAETEVTKSMPTLPEQAVGPAPTPEKSGETLPKGAESPEEAVTAKEVPSSAPEEKPQMPTAPSPAKGTGSDLSSLENRLARLELLLSGTLDVRIVE